MINPILENPQDHLEIDPLGILHPKNNSDRGQTCIDVFGLNIRPALVEERMQTYKDVRDKLILYFLAIGMRSPDVKERYDILEAHRNGEKPYTLSARLAIKDFNEETRIQSIFSK